MTTVFLTAVSLHRGTGHVGGAQLVPSRAVQDSPPSILPERSSGAGQGGLGPGCRHGGVSQTWRHGGQRDQSRVVKLAEAVLQEAWVGWGSTALAGSGLAANLSPTGPRPLPRARSKATGGIVVPFPSPGTAVAGPGHDAGRRISHKRDPRLEYPAGAWPRGHARAEDGSKQGRFGAPGPEWPVLPYSLPRDAAKGRRGRRGEAPIARRGGSFCFVSVRPSTRSRAI